MTDMAAIRQTYHGVSAGGIIGSVNICNGAYLTCYK